jgi:putative sterol carrier protein
MPDPTADFFDRLGRSGHEPHLKKVSGTVRFDLAEDGRTKRWFVTVAKGDVTVSRTGGNADCVAGAEKRLFDLLVTGRQNAMAALLRGEIRAEGNLELMVLFQRLFPGPPRTS